MRASNFKPEQIASTPLQKKNRRKAVEVNRRLNISGRIESTDSESSSSEEFLELLYLTESEKAMEKAEIDKMSSEQVEWTVVVYGQKIFFSVKFF